MSMIISVNGYTETYILFTLAHLYPGCFLTFVGSRVILENLPDHANSDDVRDALKKTREELLSMEGTKEVGIIKTIY